MKKLLLTAGSRPATLLLAPLYDALHKSKSYKPLALLAALEGTEPISADLATCFNIGEVMHTITLTTGTPVEQLATVMASMEKILVSEKPDLVLVCGSDNTALGAAITAAKLGFPVAAVDAGLRSYERSDAEEINRVVIDAMAGLHFVSEHSGEYNLINEGVADENVFFAGNLSIDSLVALMQHNTSRTVAADLGLLPKQYAMVYLNPDEPSTSKEQLDMLLRLLQEMSGKTTILMPVVAGLSTLLKQHGLDTAFSTMKGLRMIAYPCFGELLALLRDSALLLINTEELQSEATVMNVPCLTMMETTSRPATIEIGTNILVGIDEQEIVSQINDILHSGKHRTSRSKIPEQWDGAAAARIVAALNRKFSGVNQ